MAHYQALPTFDPQSSTQEALTKPWAMDILHLDDPATDAWVDYKTNRCRVIAQTDTLQYAEHVIQRDACHELFVENTEGGIVGILSLRELHGPHAMEVAAKQLINHDNILVKSIMIPLSKLPMMEASIFAHAKIGNVLATLDAFKANFLLILADAAGEDSMQLCGLLNRHTIKQRLPD